MGCDIHAMIERHHFPHGRKEYSWWVNAGDPNIGRDYEMFAVLAGVRNDTELRPIAEPRGVPKDACSAFEAWATQYGEDGHSHSWLTLAEMKAFAPEQEIFDESVILQRDAGGKITMTAAATTGRTLGVVGKRKVFGLWGRESWDALLAKMEAAKEPLHTDDDVRLVFFFDN